MTIQSRSRSRIYPLFQGTYGVVGYGEPYTQPYHLGKDTCDDVIGNFGKQNPFLSRKYRFLQYPDPLIKQVGLETCTNLLPTVMYTSGSSTFSETAWPHSTAYSRTVLEAIADSHPGEATVSIPNFIFELKDLPGMYKDYAKTVKKIRKLGKKYRPSVKDAAKQHLAYNFGWAPLFSDLKSIFDVSEGVSRQAARLVKAQNEGFVSTRGYRGSTQSKVTKEKYPFSSGPNFASGYATAIADIESTAWTSSRWKISKMPPVYGLLTGGNRNLILDQLGLDASFDTVWNAVPWSWLVDWTTDASSVIKIHSNKGGFRFDSAVAMEKSRRVISLVPYGSHASHWKNKAIIVFSETKSRRIVNPTIQEATINIFNGHQLSILASLLIPKVYR